MSQIETIYKWLARDKSPEADRTLAAALEHAEPPYAARIATILLNRATETASGGLVANYTRIPPDMQRQLHARPEMLRAGIAHAMKERAPRGRQNALTLLAEHPCPQLSYLVADALRDSSLRMREAAARVLRSTAEQLLNDAALPTRTGCAASPQGPAERAALVEALREALRTFELHRRSDVLEVCLWFAKDLGDGLWDAISGRRTHTGYVVEQRLDSWNHPRLAGFLLLALGQPAWSQAAQTLLNSWRTRSELLAILQHADLLANPRVRANLHLLNGRRLLAAADPMLTDLPPEARGQVPHWICRLGFTYEERLRCLMLWQASPLPEVQRAAVYALAAVDTADSMRILDTVASQPGRMRAFAKWFVWGKRAAAGTGPQAPNRAREQAHSPVQAGPDLR